LVKRDGDLDDITVAKEWGMWRAVADLHRARQHNAIGYSG
jgi:hypothetical protein